MHTPRPCTPHTHMHTYYTLPTPSLHSTYTRAYVLHIYCVHTHCFPTYMHACLLHVCVVLLLPSTLTDHLGGLSKIPSLGHTPDQSNANLWEWEPGIRIFEAAQVIPMCRQVWVEPRKGEPLPSLKSHKLGFTGQRQRNGASGISALLSCSFCFHVTTVSCNLQSKSPLLPHPRGPGRPPSSECPGPWAAGSPGAKAPVFPRSVSGSR